MKSIFNSSVRVFPNVIVVLITTTLFVAFSHNVVLGQDLSKPVTTEETIFHEKDGMVAVEAEHFFKQTLVDKRAFHLTSKDNTPKASSDGDPPHVGGASNGAYIEILPDTRRNHGEKLIPGENFSNEPGKLAVVHYKVNITTPGRYYVWVRAHSTGSEDNGLHVGINGEWPATGQRLQWCVGKQTWHWESKQRTQKVHCGVPHLIYLDIEKPGLHTVHFSMREDGFEFDKWLMTTNKNFSRPDSVGPVSTATGPEPKEYEFVNAPNRPKVPEAKPQADQRLGNEKKMDGKKANDGKPGSNTDAAVIRAKDFEIDGTNYYLDQGKWLAINPEKNKSATAKKTIALPNGKYNLTLRAIGENDGQSTYQISVGDKKLAPFKCPLGKEMFDTGPEYHGRWSNVAIEEGQIVAVTSTIGSADGAEYSRARWEALVFRPADAATRKAAAKFLEPTGGSDTKSAGAKSKDKRDRSTSPTKSVSKLPLVLPRVHDGDGSAKLSGELKTWHKVTVSINGPYAHEQDNAPNPFLDFRLQVDFRHADGTTYRVPGYFAADGNAGESSSEAGTIWRAHFAPDRAGDWTYVATIARGENVAIDPNALNVEMVRQSGTFSVAPTDKTGRDFRGKGRLQYVGNRYLRHAGSGEYFLKAGADAPETLLGYADFDGTVAGKPAKVPLKKFEPHLQDWHEGDPTWKGDKGKGLIGAINYLSGKGCNAFSFLTYNAGGDGDNVWPFIQRDDKLHYDCSKLDQWGIVFDHGTQKGMYLHFKLQETENDDHRAGHKKESESYVPTSLDGGNLGRQRKLYLREMVARYGHNLALNWNLGEENTQSTKQQLDMINYIRSVDPYGHNLVVHTFPNEREKVYNALLGDKSQLTGVSLQNSSIYRTHADTVKWVRESSKTSRPWVVAFDESGTAQHGQCPDLGYKGFDGSDKTGKKIYDQHAVRRATLWGTLMAGGAGVEYYFGYQFAENDLVCEDWRSRDQSWDYCRIALTFFRDNKIPFQEMSPADERVGNPKHDNGVYCLAKPNDIYLVYIADGNAKDLDLSDANGKFSVSWFNPRTGGELIQNEAKLVDGGTTVQLDPGKADSEDWLAVVRRTN